MKSAVSSVHRLFTACLLFTSLMSTSSISHANDELWQQLQAGGKVVLMRHAPVIKGTDSGNPLLRDVSCKKERNLSKQGRLDAETLGNRFKSKRIPLSDVLYSPYCRTTDTARIAFGKAEPAQYLSLSRALTSDEADTQTEQLSQIIGAYKGKGNLILISHEPNIRAISFEPLKHLDFVVLQPMGDGEFEELGVIRFNAQTD